MTTPAGTAPGSPAPRVAGPGGPVGMATPGGDGGAAPTGGASLTGGAGPTGGDGGDGAGSAPKTLGGWLRARSDGELAALLAARPDLATPPPADFEVLASRVGIRVSVMRVLERVDAFALQICEAMCLLRPAKRAGGIGLTELIAFCSAPAGKANAAVADAGKINAGKPAAGKANAGKPAAGKPAAGKANAGKPAAGKANTGMAVAVRVAVARLRSLALVWGPDDDLRLVGSVVDLLGDRPLGLGRPVWACLSAHQANQLTHIAAAVAPVDPADTEFGTAPGAGPAPGAGGRRTPTRQTLVDAIVDALADPDRVRLLVDECSEPARHILERLAAGPALGTTADALRLTSAAAANTPVEELLARGLLVGIDGQTVELPREIGLVLRGDRPAGELAPEPPALTGRELGSASIADAAALNAAEAVRMVTALAEAWGAEPVVPLRAGGLGVRDLRYAARLLDVDERIAALIVEVAYAAGLVDVTSGQETVIVPTAAYDRWGADDLARRWALLAAAWLDTPRVAALTGDRDDKGKAVAVLSPATRRGSAADVRRAVLATLAEAPAGTVPDRASVHARMRWRAPRWGGPMFDQLVQVAFDEAETLGITGRGGLPSPGRELVAGGTRRDGSPAPLDAVAAALAPLLPKPVEEIIIQADLTAVAPGPLVGELAAELALLADVESTGAATVYRISDASVRRALDEGRTAEDIHDFLARAARSGVPPALTYLVDDVARRHGLLRSGPASSYLRCDDTALLAEVVASRQTRTLGLRRIAPTVVVSSSPVPVLLDGLREAGYAPAAEGPDGRVVLARVAPNRTPGRGEAVRSEPVTSRAGGSPDLVRMIRRGDEAARAVRVADGGHPDDAVARTGSAILVALADAARAGRRVLLGYVDAQGASTRHIVAPTTVGGGFLVGWDERDRDVRRFVLHRVTSVRELDR